MIYFVIHTRIDTNVTLTSMTICLLFDSINWDSWLVQSRLAWYWRTKGTTSCALNVETFVFYFTLLFACVCARYTCKRAYFVVCTSVGWQNRANRKESDICAQRIVFIAFLFGSAVNVKCCSSKWKHQVYTRETWRTYSEHKVTRFPSHKNMKKVWNRAIK